MKTLAVLLAGLLAGLLPFEAPAAENKYDVLAGVLTPFVSVLAKQTTNPNRAMALTLRLEGMTGLSEELVGTSAEVALQYPDKLRLRAPVLGEELTICRRGQKIWVHPGAKAEALLKLATATKSLPSVGKEARLEPFRLPFPEKQLVFLPALFRVDDRGSVQLGATPCRVLDLQLMPELARSLAVAGWSARVWVRPDHRPARLHLTGPEFQATIGFQAVKFLPSLPDSTWQPTPEEAEDVWEIPPAKYQQLLKLVVGSRGDR